MGKNKQAGAQVLISSVSQNAWCCFTTLVGWFYISDSGCDEMPFQDFAVIWDNYYVNTLEDGVKHKVSEMLDNIWYVTNAV